MERMDASLDTLRVLQRDGAGRPEEQGTGMAAGAILNNADLPGGSGAERPDLKSYAAACTPRAGLFSRQGACRPE